ncbi:MAG TPA: threonine synthase [Chloroflexota bacterium]|nr:threonine synthase [Chloroflexota bacterium]
MGSVKGLQCRECGELYPAEAIHVCEMCFGPLEVAYDYDVIGNRVSRESIAAGPKSLWRYKALLPIESDRYVDSQAGFTPLVQAANLGKALGLKNVYVKNDTVNPTFSFKDRPVSIASSKALELGFDTLACASTGNLAGSVAAHAAKAGMRGVVFIPADLEPSKISGALAYSPTLVAVDGNYDDVNRVCSEIADRYRWAFVNINMRPYYSEGSKTLAYEVAEQLGWRLPDRVIVPIASGSLFTKVWKGFQELSKVGLIDGSVTLPKMVGAQALGCSPVVTAWDANTLEVEPVKPMTIAKSLAIGNPADGYYSLKIMKQSGGVATSVTDDEIIEGMKLLARTEGIFAETAGGVTVAVLKKLAAAGQVDPDELIVVYVTGNGLKTQEALVGQLNDPVHVRASMASVEEALSLANLATSVA